MFKERYFNKKEKLLSSHDINKQNLKTINQFLRNKEYELKRKNNLPELDERSYKTLYFYIGKITNINKWFKNKSWSKLTEEEIEKVVDDLEDGRIVNNKGLRYSDRAWYYQIMSGQLFELVDKAYVTSKMCKKFGIKGRINDNEVRFISECEFKKLVEHSTNVTQKCLMWLEFDYGENIGSLLELEDKDFMLQINEDTGEEEYKIVFRKDILKRSRTPRTEINNYPETAKFLKIILNDLKPLEKKVYNRALGKCEVINYPTNKLFKFGLKSAQKFLDKAGEKSGVRCMPNGEKVTWKDLRSSMACDLINKDWTTDEVNMRLGHKPSSRVIDKYVTFLAKDRTRPKKKIYDGNLKKVETELEKTKDLTKLQTERIKKMKKHLNRLQILEEYIYRKMPKEELEAMQEKAVELHEEQTAELIYDIK